MEQNTKQHEEKRGTKIRLDDINLIIGYVLLIPAFISVPLFLYTLLFDMPTLSYFGSWTEAWTDDKGTSALPIYFGIMAIAGAYLIKSSKK